MSIHIDHHPVEGCGNPDTYGEICVKCNRCGRFPVFTRGASDLNNRMIGRIPDYIHFAWQNDAIKLAKSQKERFARVTIKTLKQVAPLEVLVAIKEYDRGEPADIYEELPGRRGRR